VLGIGKYKNIGIGLVLENVESVYPYLKTLIIACSGVFDKFGAKLLRSKTSPDLKYSFFVLI